MSSKTRRVKRGLRPTPYDPRDFSFAGVFGAININEVPLTDFMTAPAVEIKDQGGTDMCTAYALCSVSEDQEKVPLDPGFTFALIKRKQGTWKTWGGDLRSGCKVAQDYGFIEVGDNPQDFGNKPRNFIANWNNWLHLNELLRIAARHKKQSFLKVDGPYDTFDNFRAALWVGKDEGKSIYTGCVWRPGWLAARGGILPDRALSGGVGHAFKICGQKIINGQPYLVIQNSYGTDVGDHGYFYMNRRVANRELTFNGYTFTDLSPEEVQSILQGKELYVGEKITIFDRIKRAIKVFLST